MTPLLSMSAVMERLNVNKRVIYRLVRSRKLDAVRVGKELRFEDAAITRFIAQARVSAQPTVTAPAPRIRPTQRRSRVRGVELPLKGADYFLKKKGLH